MPSSISAWIRRLGRGLMLALAGAAAAAVVAQTHAPDGGGGALAPEIAQTLQQFAASQRPAAGGARVEVQLGTLDPRLKLAPCARIEPYLPAGTRLWGRARIGLRCTDGQARWNVFLPVTVKVWGPGTVLATSLPAGAVLTASDLAQAEVDLAEDPSAAVADPAAAVGRTLARAMQPGQGLRAAHLRARQWFAAGETVRVVAAGAGFAIAAEGQALGPGIEGQPARVRTENGRILTGLPVGERRVELAL